MSRLALVLAIVACDKHERAVPGAPSGSASAVTSDAVGRDCDAIRKAHVDALAMASGACTTAADCACYNPVGGPPQGCGGVTDATTATTLSAIERDFHAARCQYTHQCGASVCAPRCDAGRCR